MAYTNGPKLVTAGLVCLLDAGTTKSWVSGSATWADLSSNGNHFTVAGNPAASNGGIQFSGLTQYATCNNAALGDWGTGNFCMDVVCAIYAYGGFSATIMKRAGVSSIGASGQPGFAHRLGSQFFAQDNFGSAAGGAIISLTNAQTVSPSIGQPVQYTFNVSRGNSGLQNTGLHYVNGQLVATSVVTFNGNGIISGASPINFFREAGGGNVTTGLGYIFRAYNRALTSAEIAQNWNATKGRFNL